MDIGKYLIPIVWTNITEFAIGILSNLLTLLNIYKFGMLNKKLNMLKILRSDTLRR